MFQRQIDKTLRKAAGSFPVVFLTGPRQSGKTTLLRHLFPEYTYVSLERPDVLERITTDPLGFLGDNKNLIIDEAQRFPGLFSYLQGIVDEKPRPAQFILSGSQNFLLSHHINQTLAGRACVLELLPLSYNEYRTHPKLPDVDIWELLFKGGYPRPYQEGQDYGLWCGSYLRTYVERDVRTLIQVKDLLKFQTFLKLCAGRHGQLLNLTALAVDAGIAQTTTSEWLSILEASYITFRLKPYHKNFNKRMIKTPKLYFYDSGLVCYLLGIESPDHLKIHSQRGAIFEGFVISEFIKNRLSEGKPADFYFWRDQQGLEIDLLWESGEMQNVCEIKSSQTFRTEFLKSLVAWTKLSQNVASQSMIAYAGDESFVQQGFPVKAWKELGNL
ncbi:MAG: ATP-binding protein [Alphaproteobacteria bacterium]